MKTKLTSVSEFRLDHTMIRVKNLEITYNWDQVEDYTRGNAWGHLAIKVPNVYSASRYLKKHGVEFTKEPSPMKGGTRILAFIKDPDGYPIELNEPLGEHISNATC